MSIIKVGKKAARLQSDTGSSIAAHFLEHFPYKQFVFFSLQRSEDHYSELKKPLGNGKFDHSKVKNEYFASITGKSILALSSKMK